MYNKMMSDLVEAAMKDKWIRVHDNDLEGFHRIVDIVSDSGQTDCGCVLLVEVNDPGSSALEIPLSIEWHYTKFDLLPHAPVENLIEGRWDSRTDRLQLFVDGDEILVGDSQKVWNHGNGFAVGYPGSSVAQAALAILLAVTSDAEVSVRAHQTFKESFLVRLPQTEDFTLRINVHRWLEGAGYVG